MIWNDIYYTGREYDKEIGLYYNRARYYSPKLWRFIARDPIDIADDINLYAYVGNNPVMYVDLMGTEAKLIKYMFGDEYISIVRNKWSIAWIDAIFIEANRLSNNDVSKSAQRFANVLKGTTNRKLERRQPKSLWVLKWRDKVWHFATTFDLTYNKGFSPQITDTIGILWEIKDIPEPMVEKWGEGYSQNDINADRYGIEFALQLKRNTKILPSDILSKKAPDNYFNDINFNLIPQVY